MQDNARMYVRERKGEGGVNVEELTGQIWGSYFGLKDGKNKGSR